MALNQTQQFAKWIAGLAAGAGVSLEGHNPELEAALINAGAVLNGGLGEFIVSLQPGTQSGTESGAGSHFAHVTPSTRVMLVPAGGRLMELLKRAFASGFLPDTEVEPPDCAADWVLLRRSDSPLNLRIDSLEAVAADLEADRDRLSVLLDHTKLEFRSVKNSPAWKMIGLYRKWLERQRKRMWLPFQVYDRMAAAVVASGTANVELDDSADVRGKIVAPATRFTSMAEAIQDWRRVFQRLAAHAGVDGLAQRQPAPKISIITPLWNTKPEWLAEAAVSIFDQTSHDWEWCIVDDCSTDTSFDSVLEAIQASSPQVHFKRLERNSGISGASNEGLKLATGEYACFLDHDDLLHPEAIEQCLEQFAEGCDAVYTDSDKADEEGVCDEPFYKPNWSPEYFRSVMYVGHLLCVRRGEALNLGGFDSRFNGVQDFEFFLRYSERFSRIGHIPRILYHWRRVEGSTASSTSAKKNITRMQQRAVAGQLERLGLRSTAVRGPRPHRVTVEPGPRADTPRVSIIIPTKDAPEVLSMCLDSIFTLSTYQNFQVICADNETTDENALAMMKRPRVDRVFCPGRFNFSRVNNESAKLADGEFLVFLNNDIEVVTPDWIEQLLYHAEQSDVGAVGALLLYPDRKVQHCGIGLGFRGTADHILRAVDSTLDGYAGSLAHAREVSAVTAACLMMRKKLFEEMGGFDEHYFTAYQDVDLCLRLHAAGKRNIYTPRAVLIHHESYSRKMFYDSVDRNLLLDSWEEFIEAGDPFYNVNFDRSKVEYQISPNADLGEFTSRVSLWSPGKQSRAGVAVGKKASRLI